MCNFTIKTDLKKAKRSDSVLKSLLFAKVDDIDPQGVTNLPGEGEVTYPSQVSEVLIPYQVVTDTYDYYEVRSYINDVNRENTEVLSAYDETGTTRESYTYGRDRLDYSTGDDTYFYGYTGTGSVAELTNEEGDVEASYTYDPFGEAALTEGSVDTGNPYTYNNIPTGQPQTSTCGQGITIRRREAS